MSDGLSDKHYKAIRTEIEGRFFSIDEALALKQAIDAHVVGDAATRKMAALCWPDDQQPRYTCRFCSATSYNPNDISRAILRPL